VLIDADGKILLSNKKFDKLLGIKNVNLPGKEIIEYFDLDEDLFKRKINESLRGQEIKYLSKIKIRPGGERKVKITIKPQVLESETSALELEIVDITEDLELRKKAEESKLKYEHIFNNAAEGIALFNLEGEFISVNKAALEQMGYSEEEIIGHKFSEFLDDRLKPISERFFRNSIKGRSYRANYFRIKGKSGKEKPVSLSLAPYKSEDGETTGIILMTYDRTAEMDAFKDKERSEREYKRILNNLQDIYYSCDNDDVIQYINPAASRMLKIPDHRELIGKKLIDTLCINKDEARKALDELNKTGVISNSPLIIKTYTGEEIYCEENSHIINDDSGNPVGREGTIRDETNRKIIEKALADSEEQYRTLMKNLPVGVYRTTSDPAGLVVYSNPAFVKLFGYDNLDDMRVVDVVNLYGQPEIRAEFLDTLNREGVLNNAEYHMIKKNGETIWVADSCHAVRDEDGNIKYIDGIIEDITARKKLEAELRESEKRYRLLAENSNDVIWTLDLNLIYTYISPSVKQLRGFEPHEVIGQSISIILTPESYENVKAVFGDVVQKIIENPKAEHPKSMTLEIELKRKGGSTLWAEINAGILKDEDGKPIGILGVTRDISERKAAELIRANQLIILDEKVKERTKELAKANQLLVRSNRVRSEFLANISHELRSPLTTILGYTEIMRGFEMPNQELSKHLEIVSSQGTLLLRLVNSLLDIVKLEAGNINLYLVDTNLNEIVFLLEKHTKIKLISERITLEKNLDESIENCYLDSQKIYQVVRNLIDNAIKFSSRGSSIYISTRKTKKFLQIMVKDQGIGISKEKLDQIFDPFYQVDGSSTRNYEGAGLGLHLVKSYIELHEGVVEVESEQRKGTLFTIKLPTNLRPDVDTPPLKEKKGETEITLGGMRPKVMIVDDDEEITELIKIVLKKTYEIEHVSNGQLAIDNVKIFKPDLILMDLSMPVLDGYEATRKLKADPETRNIPILALSARAMEDEVEKAFNAGCDDHIAKPFKIKDIQQIIKKHIIASK